jgi:hypothetical protein
MPCDIKTVCGISSDFSGLFPTQGQVVYALRTRAPLYFAPEGTFTFDLHVLSPPPAFVLSQDQTLRSSGGAAMIGSPDAGLQ